jgi:NAD(P)-dependent dehydrogenase (short-subunit alcohol dehydrogenase family)
MRRRKKCASSGRSIGPRAIRVGAARKSLANLIVFALSDAASFVNGAVLVVDNAMDKS